MKNLYAPARLDIVSEAPEDIALAIVSEVEAVFESPGRFSRERRNEIQTIAPAVRGEAA